MIIRNIAGTAITLAALGVWSQPSLAASFREVGANCVVLHAQRDNGVAGSCSSTAEAGIELSGRSGICGGRTIRTSSSIASFTALTRIRTVHQNMCAGTNAFVPVSYLLSRLP
ncbi:MAG: hypothetical protein J0H42_00600 [Rhizobiales bacterium]|nr:hypothetical protein [Hyphomicrobiales bacterium]